MVRSAFGYAHSRSGDYQCELFAEPAEPDITPADPPPPATQWSSQ